MDTRRPQDPRRTLTVFTNALEYGGAEVQLVDLARRFKSRGWHVGVVSLFRPRVFLPELAAAGIDVRSLEFGDRRGGLLLAPRLAIAVYRLSRILREWQPDVLHCHMIPANHIGRLARLLCRVPVLVCTAHNSIEGGLIRILAYRATDPLCDLTTAVSRAATERAIRDGRVPSDRALYVPNAVDTDRFSRDPEARRTLRAELKVGDRFVWLAVGRYAPAKDWPNMLHAFRRASESGPSSVLLVVGYGPLEDEIKSLAARLGIAEHVRFLGVRSDVARLMSAADAFLMSSEREAMPIVVLEAAASSLPIVATDLAGIAEVVTDGRTGFLVPRQDSPALARAMRQLLEADEQTRLAMGAAGRVRVEEHFSLNRIVDRWEAIYADLFKKNTGSVT